MKELLNHEDAINYAEKYWKEFFEEMDESFKNTVLSIESQGKFADCPNDQQVIKALEQAISIVPPFEEDIILYRGGRKRDFCSNRPFLSATFLKSTGENFSEKEGKELYKIIIRKGSRAIPVCAAGLGYRHEEEVAICTRFLHTTKDPNVFEYYS